jgi:hypothetical protein
VGMRNLVDILKEISRLSPNERVSIYSRLSAALTKKEKALALLERLNTRGQGLWGEDAQEYVNRLRADDRF